MVLSGENRVFHSFAGEYRGERDETSLVTSGASGVRSGLLPRSTGRRRAFGREAEQARLADANLPHTRGKRTVSGAKCAILIWLVSGWFPELVRLEGQLRSPVHLG
jgi:hypothetical protein